MLLDPAPLAIPPSDDRVAWTLALGRRLTIITLGNAKLAKSGDDTVDASLELAPAKVSGFDLCPDRSLGCERACIFTAGNGRFEQVQQRRIARTHAFFNDRKRFAAMLAHDVALIRGSVDRLSGPRPSIHVRLNTFSDLPWERVRLYPGVEHPVIREWNGTALAMLSTVDVNPYDYTASADRAMKAVRWARESPDHRYHLTFSRKETTPDDVVHAVLDAGGTVTIPFAQIPETWHGYRVVNGDHNDQHYNDPPGVVVGLSPRGRGRGDTTGFIVR